MVGRPFGVLFPLCLEQALSGREGMLEMDWQMRSFFFFLWTSDEANVFISRSSAGVWRLIVRRIMSVVGNITVAAIYKVANSVINWRKVNSEDELLLPRSIPARQSQQHKHD